MQTSRTEQKRQARQIEELAGELADLSLTEIAGLPCEELLKKELAAAKNMKSGAWKRQLKFIARELRASDTGPLFAYLAERRGSKLQRDRDFHTLERWRNAILNEAIEARQQSLENDLPFSEKTWRSDTIVQAASQFPGLDETAVKRAASRFAVNRKPLYSREIFRQLHAAAERRRFDRREE